MTSKQIAAKIRELDNVLNDDMLTDAEFDKIEKEIKNLTADLAIAERREWFCGVKEIKNPSEWMRHFLDGFCTTQTRKITNRQADIFYRYNKGVFAYNGYVFQCSGANYRLGFATVVITKI